MMFQPAPSVVVLSSGAAGAAGGGRSVEEWRPLAAKGRGLLIAAGVLQLLAAALILGGAAADWWTFDYQSCVRNIFGVVLGCTSFKTRISPLAIQFEATASSGSASASTSTPFIPNLLGIVFGGSGFIQGAILALISSAVAFSAACATGALAAPGGPMPRAPPPGGCVCGCYPSVPAINGLGWCGFVNFFFSASAAGGILFGIATVNAILGTAPTMGPGVFLAAIGVIFGFVGSILSSVAGCTLRGLPGVGEGACCCVATAEAPKAAADPSVHVAMSAGAPAAFFNPMVGVGYPQQQPMGGMGYPQQGAGFGHPQPMMGHHQAAPYNQQQQQQWQPAGGGYAAQQPVYAGSPTGHSKQYV